ncbi:hypothetical protein GQ53DRAFT_455643 [Thozetella sp. PMI_491]|nr:hypothetical protein GQ53DRAFT_455643 [Thozetella sp. PMI_491]
MGDSLTLFEGYLKTHNERQWSRLSDYVSPQVIFNGQQATLESFIELQKEEVSWMPDVSMTMAGSIRVKGANALGIGIRATGTLSRPRWGISETHGPIQFRQHFICRCQRGKLSEIHVITNVDDMRAGQPEVHFAPQLSVLPPEPPVDLGELYRAYIACINARTMASDLPKFCHPVVTWNGLDMDLGKYRSLMEDTFEAIPELTFDVRVLVVDDEQQMLGVRIEFRGTPTKEYSGAQPTGRSVHFAEHAFYQLESGRIRSVQTAIDWEMYKQQLRG